MKFHENTYRKIDRNVLYYRDRIRWPRCSVLDDYRLVDCKGKYTALTSNPVKRIHKNNLHTNAFRIFNVHCRPWVT
jgi:hypothetical protein